MTAHELARILLAGPDLPVYVLGYEGGLHDATEPDAVEVVRDYRTMPPRYLGPHEEAHEWDRGTKTMGLVLRR